MKISKAVPFALAIAGLFVQLSANASGNAHKYPVVPPKEAEVAKPVEAVIAKPSEPVVAKPAAAASVKPSEAAISKPAEAVAAKPADAPIAKANASNGLGIPLVIVSRYEPLSGRDSLDAVPDLNRGRGKGK